VNVTFAFTVTLPVRFSLRFFFPLDLIVSFTVPAALTALAAALTAREAPLGRCLTSPLPVRTSVPGPGTLTAALFAAPAGRISAKIGPRPVAAAGGIAFGASFLVIGGAVDPTPDYAGAFLPGFMLGGFGVGLLISSLPAAVTASLPPERFATGSAVFGMSRQLGAAIGVAVLIAILANPAPDELLDRLRDGWVFMAGTGFAATLVGLAIGPAARVRARASASRAHACLARELKQLTASAISSTASFWLRPLCCTSERQV
jgi:MFS family permease